MATEVKHRRGTDSEIMNAVPATGELWFNVTDNTIHMGDGATPGGIKQKDILSVKHFGAIGDGVTDDTVAIQAAISTSLTNEERLYWPTGQYLTTSSITDLHSVKHYGDGVIKRGSNLFYIEPKEGQTNNLFITTVGSLSNDGLSLSEATTSPQIDTYLKNYMGNILSGQWVVNISSGSYVNFELRLDQIYSANRIIIKGDSPSLTSQPTTELIGNASLTGCIIINTNMFVQVESVFIKDYTNSNASGILSNNGNNLYALNVWADNVGFAAINFSAQNRAYVTGGTITNSRVGVRCYSGTTFTLGFDGVSNPTTIENCTQSGLDLRDTSSGDVFYTNLDVNTVGIAIYNNSRARIQDCSILNSTSYGIRAYTSGTYNLSGSNTLTGNIQDFSSTSYASDFSLFDADTTLRPYKKISSVVVTGSTIKTILNNEVTIPQRELIDRGKSLEIKCYGTHRNAGTKDVEFKIGATVIFTFQLPTTGGVRLPFIVNINVYAFSSTLQKYICEVSGAFVGMSNGASDLGLASSGQILEINTTNSDAAGECTLEVLEVLGTGIGNGTTW